MSEPIDLLTEANKKIFDLELSQSLLQRELADTRARAEENYSRYAEAARQHADMMNLYIAAHRLHESLDRKDVLAAIQEIIINLIGSEELAVFELAEDNKMLRLVDHFGIEPNDFRELPLGEGPLAESILGGRAYIEEHPEAGNKLTACVPLMAGEKAVGLVAVFSLLPQKASLQQVDRELFDVLRAHGGSALFCTRLVAEK